MTVNASTHQRTPMHSKIGCCLKEKHSMPPNPCSLSNTHAQLDLIHSSGPHILECTQIWLLSVTLHAMKTKSIAILLCFFISHFFKFHTVQSTNPKKSVKQMAVAPERTWFALKRSLILSKDLFEFTNCKRSF